MTNLRVIGDREVWPVGLGGAQWSLTEHPDDDHAIQVIHAALDAGVTLIDTARAYTTMGENPDPLIPIEVSASTLQGLKNSGAITRIGLSNVDQEQLARAQTVAGIDAVQNPLSLHNPADLAFARQLAAEEIAFLAHSPLGGPGGQRELAQRFPGAAAVSDRRGVSVAAVALGWLLSQSAIIIPVLGARRPSSIVDSALHAPTDLTAEELDSIAAEPE